METKRSKKKFLGIPMPGILNLKRSDTSTSCPTDGEQDSAPSSQVRSAAASSRQTDEPDTKSVLDSNPPTAILIDNPLERESTCQPDPDRPPETDQLFVSSSRPGTPSDHQLQELPDLLAASTPTVHPATAQRDSNNGLWGEAYTNLRGKVKEVASQYEDDISLYLGNVTGVDSLSTPELTQHEMVALSNQVIKRWLGEWDTCDEELSAEQVLETIKEVKEAIERSLERNPDAIIAWGALPLTIKAISKTRRRSEKVIGTLEYITVRLEWYCTLAYLVQPEAETSSNIVKVEARQSDLSEKIGALYEAILGVFLGVIYTGNYDSSASDLDLELGNFFSAEKGLPLRDNFRVEHLFRKSSSKLDSVQYKPASFSGDESRSEKNAHDASGPLDSLQKLHAVDPSQLTSDLEEGRAEILSSAVANACKIPEFANLFSETSGLVEALCVHGSPGTGKTMLLMGVIWNLSQQKSESMFKGHVSYFNCSDRSARSGTNILKSMIWQVLQKQPNLSHYLDEQFQLTGRDDFDDPEDLLAMVFVFFRVVSDPNFEPTFFVIESLDQGPARNDFMDLISTSIELSSSKARWLISVAQPDFMSTGIHGEASSLHFRNMFLDSYGPGCLVSPIEYASFLVEQLPKDINLCEDTCQALAELLCNNSNGNYLWMDLACRAISATDPWNAKELLESLPHEIEDLWIDRKDRIENLDWNTPSYCAQVLDVMAVVYRPLHLTELADLVSIPAGVFLRGVVEKCVSILEVRKNMVFFTCVAAKDFLRKTSSPSPISHAQMTQNCLESISRINSPVPEDAPESGHYASVYWMNHLAERDDTKWFDSTIESVVKFAQSNTVDWIDRLIEDECLPHALAQARHLESVLSEQSQEVEGSAALLKVIQDIHELLDVCASKLANSKASGVSFYPSQDVMNQHLRRGGWPTLTVPFPQRDQSLVHNLKGHTDWIRSCAFSPDAQLIASASDDYTVRIWNTRTGKMQHVFDDFQSWIFSIAWSPADNKLLAAANGECVSILDMATGQYKRTLDFESQGRVRSLAFSADGTRLAAAVGRNTVVWDILSFHQVATMAATNDDDTVEHVEFCMTNNILLLLSESSTTVWELEDGEATRKIEIDEEASVYAGTLSPDGKYVALATESSLELRNTEDQSVGGTPLSMTVLISALAFSPDGKHLAVGFEDGDIKIFDPWTGHPVQTLKGHSRPVYKVSFSSSGDHLISCSSDKSLRLWRIESDVAGQLANHEEGHLQPITCVEISPDGRFLVSASEDQSLCLWDGRDGTFKSKCEHEDSVVLSIGFSSDGSLLVTSARDGSVRLFEISSETEALKFIRLFEGHTDWVRSVMFTPDGNWIASGSDDSTVRLWNITDQRAGPILLEAHEDYVRSVAFSPDGTLLASGGDDRRVIIWDPQTSAQADEVHPVQILRDLSSMVSAMVFTSDDSQLIASCYDSGIAIWDTETWSCRIFESSNVFRSLRTIPDQSLWLETEIGAILLQPDPLVRKEDLPQQCLFGISREGWWITYRGRERCFCLPKAYQPDVDEKSTLVRGNRVVIGCLSGQVLLLNFEK